jgi:site-specific DNA-methyltransferase (adenine-specific)
MIIALMIPNQNSDFGNSTSPIIDEIKCGLKSLKIKMSDKEISKYLLSYPTASTEEMITYILRSQIKPVQNTTSEVIQISEIGNSKTQERKLETVKIADLIHLPESISVYGIDGYESMIESLKKFGQREALIVDQYNRVISGNRRFQAMKVAGFPTVDIIRIYVDPETDLIELVFTHNLRGKRSDLELMSAVKFHREKYLKGSGNDLVEGENQWHKKAERDLGIGKDKLYRLNKVLEFKNKDGVNPYINYMTDGDATLGQCVKNIDMKIINKEDKEKKIIEAKTLIRDDVKIYRGNCKDLSSIPIESVQCAFTSPAYGPNEKGIQVREYNAGDGELGTEENAKEYIKSLILHFAETIRVLKHTGSFFLNIRDTDFQDIPERVKIALIDTYNLRCVNTIIWYKPNPKRESGKHLTQSTEYIYHFVKSYEDYYYDPIDIPTVSKNLKPSIPHHRSKSKNDHSENFNPIFPDDSAKLVDYWTDNVVTKAGVNHWYTKTFMNGMKHPAPFPEMLCFLPILLTTKPGDVVMDPCMGLGTVPRVARMLNRRAIGIDLKQQYVNAVVDDFNDLEFLPLSDFQQE